MPCETNERDERKWDGAIENANIWVFVWISINKTHMHIGSRTSSCYAMLRVSRSFLMLTNGIYYSQTKFNQYTLWFQRKNEFYPKSKVEFQPIYIYILLHIYYITISAIIMATREWEHEISCAFHSLSQHHIRTKDRQFICALGMRVLRWFWYIPTRAAFQFEMNIKNMAIRLHTNNLVNA